MEKIILASRSYNEMIVMIPYMALRPMEKALDAFR